MYPPLNFSQLVLAPVALHVKLREVGESAYATDLRDLVLPHPQFLKGRAPLQTAYRPFIEHRTPRRGSRYGPSPDVCRATSTCVACRAPESTRDEALPLLPKHTGHTGRR